jgi:hypothetical protein
VSVARFAVACLAATGVAACGLAVNGLESGDGGVGVLDGTADVTNADASYEASGGDDTGAQPDGASNDTGTTGDVAVAETGLVDGCVPTGPESCTNGIDDDCNGLTDCADPACTTQGYTCVPPLPAMGWDYVAFDATSQTACPATLTQKLVDVDPMNLSAPAVCGCTCAPGTPPSCEQGNISWTHGPNNQCGTGGPTNTPASGGTCNAMSLMVDAYVLAAQPPPAGGTCTASTTTTVPPTGATKGEVCSGETVFGAGCTAPEVCALAPTGFTPCLHHGGANMGCPAGYPTSNSVGTLMDNRGCGNCTCGTPTATCTVGSWDFFGTSDCSGAVGLVLETNDQCNQTTSPGAYASNRFSSTLASAATCGAPTTAPPAIGAAMLTGADTICCD